MAPCRIRSGEGLGMWLCAAYTVVFNMCSNIEDWYPAPHAYVLLVAFGWLHSVSLILNDSMLVILVVVQYRWILEETAVLEWLRRAGQTQE